ncbi:hypothetical protein Tco_1382404, partial [Tanacetum coccineum]
PEQKGLPRDIPLDRIEVLRYDIKGVKVRKRKMRTKTELTLEQTQQGVSDEVLVDPYRFEDTHKDGQGGTWKLKYMFQDFRYSDTVRPS